MTNKKVTLQQSVFSIILFGFGSSVIMGISTESRQNTWIAIILACVFVVPLYLIYGRILKLFPGKNFFEILEAVFGKVAGKILTALMVCYTIHLSAMVLCNFGEFLQVFDMPETPKLPLCMLMILTTTYLARSSMRAIGKWSVVSMVFVVFVVSFTFIASVHQMHFHGLLPLTETAPKQLMKTGFQIFAFPFAETVVFLCVADAFRKDHKPYKMFFLALVATMLVFLAVFIRNLALLGRSLMEITYFPSYLAARIIEIGDFFARVESSISSNFIFAGIVKISVCLLAASKGITALFGFPDNKPFVLPVGMLALALCPILYASTMEMFAFLDYYAYYAFPFQVIIPLAAWLGAEIYVRRRKRQAGARLPADTPS